MAKSLTKKQITGIRKMDTESLLGLLRHLAGYKYGIELQNTAGIRNKSTVDPDVKKLHDDYLTVYTEAKRRVLSSTEKIRVDNFVNSSIDRRKYLIWRFGIAGVPVRLFDEAKEVTAKETWLSDRESLKMLI